MSAPQAEFAAGDFKARVAFITGAAHGQGRAVALALAAAGADIVGFDVAKPLPYPEYALGTPEELESLKAEVEALGRRALVFAGDVRDAASIQRAVDAAVAEFGRIDILFNNAGVIQYGSLVDLTEEAWDTVVDINLKGPFLVARRDRAGHDRAGAAASSSTTRASRACAAAHGSRTTSPPSTDSPGLTKTWAIELAAARHPGGEHPSRPGSTRR